MYTYLLVLVAVETKGGAHPLKCHVESRDGTKLAHQLRDSCFYLLGRHAICLVTETQI